MPRKNSKAARLPKGAPKSVPPYDGKDTHGPAPVRDPHRLRPAPRPKS